jgi:hypothetical protein
MERQNFEDSLKEAFNNAELSPSDAVWDGIELDLMKAESKKMKNRIVFYKMLAAASVIFGLALAGSSYYFFAETQGANELAMNNATNRENNKANSSNETSKSQAQLTIDPSVDGTAVQNDEGNRTTLEGVDERMTERNISEKKNNTTSRIATDEKSIAGSKDVNIDGNDIDEHQLENTSDSFKNSTSTNSKLPTTITGELINGRTTDQAVNVNKYDDGTEAYESLVMSLRRPQLAYLPPVKMNLPEQPKADEVALMLARLSDLERAEQQKEKKDKNGKETLWTSVGFAAGAFTGGNASVATKPTMNTLVASTTNDIADKEANAAGITYSVGVNLGAKVTKRWVVQGGLNYMTQSSDYTVDNAIGTPDLKTFSPASINGFDEIKGGDEKVDAKVVATAPYNVNNNVQYLSVPVQAGYLIVNRKFGIQLNAGVATDMFLKNQKTADGDNLQKIDQGRDDSPYKPVNFSGLMGAEFSYRLGQRYRLALNPGMRYPFSSIYKSEVGVKATPLTYDVGLRFRYIFQ